VSASSGKLALPRRMLRAGKEIALTALALAGGLCLLVVLAGAWLDISLIAFRTGSMAPGIEAGAIAVVQEVPATSLKPGDIATVQGHGSTLPVTHRVVTLEPDPANDEKVYLTLKGDANSSEDPVRYNVESAKTLLFSVPALGYWVMRLQSPWFMASCSVVLAALATWAFWPRKQTTPTLTEQARAG
jgi:signal peptidase